MEESSTQMFSGVIYSRRNVFGLFPVSSVSPSESAWVDYCLDTLDCFPLNEVCDLEVTYLSRLQLSHINHEKGGYQLPQVYERTMYMQSIVDGWCHENDIHNLPLSVLDRNTSFANKRLTTHFHPTEVQAGGRGGDTKITQQTMLSACLGFRTISASFVSCFYSVTLKKELVAMK